MYERPSSRRTWAKSHALMTLCRLAVLTTRLLGLRATDSSRGRPSCNPRTSANRDGAELDRVPRALGEAGAWSMDQRYPPKPGSMGFDSTAFLEVVLPMPFTLTVPLDRDRLSKRSAGSSSGF